MKDLTRSKLNLAGAMLLDLTMVPPILRFMATSFGIPSTSIGKLSSVMNTPNKERIENSYRVGANRFSEILDGMSEEEKSSISEVTIEPTRLRRFMGLPYGVRDTHLEIKQGYQNDR